MPDFIVTRNSDGVKVLRYTAAEAQEVNGFDLVSYTHAVAPDTEPAPVNPEQWKIYVGAFFDRFGAAKIGILADQDPLVQAVIKDATVRKYIDLRGRRDELLQVVGLLQSKGHAVDATAVLDAEPMASEVWNG